MLWHNNSYGQSANLRSATLEEIDFSIETIRDINCEELGKFSEKEKKVKFIFNDADLVQLQSLYKAFKEVKPIPSFDVRGSVNFIFGKAHEKFCFNMFGIFSKDGKYYFNKELLIFITNKLYKSHPEYLDTLRQYE